MKKIRFLDKVGGIEYFNLEEGQSIKKFLKSEGIPTNAVIIYKNGTIVSEDKVIANANDDIEIRQVRHYDLNVTRAPKKRNFGTYEDPIYTKSVLFDDNGTMEVRKEDFQKESYRNFVEQTFVDSVLTKDIIEENCQYIIGLSGGRDSVAFLKLLECTKHKLPNFNLTAVTVTGLPDWDEAGTFGAALKSCDLLGIEHVIVDGEAIKKHFNLNVSFAQVMTGIVSSQQNAMVMIVTHHIMRRMIEVEAEKRKVNNIFLGLNADDLVASLVTWFTSGFNMGGIPIRNIGKFKYSFPLFQITKKELTIYLKLFADELTKQGIPGRFTTGPDERSMAYAIGDHLYDLWPGIDYYLFEAFNNLSNYLIPKEEGCCNNCGATYANQKNVKKLEDVCDICVLFKELGFLRAGIAAYA